MSTVQLGLRENWKQFALLVLVNGFVGGMVGMERTLLPQLAEAEFGLAVKTAILSFILVFGISKALANYFTGILANKIGRKNLLVIGWIFALPVPFLLMYSPSWDWIILANVFLGINQGLTWSSTVVMKIDLVGEKNRGLAMGLNESVGYLAVGLVAFFTGWIAANYGLRPYPFYVGIVFAFSGLLCSWFLINDTRHHVDAESKESTIPKLKNIFIATTWKHPSLGSISQAGLVNNLNDGMIWGLFPMLLVANGFSLTDVGLLVAIYPTVWGVGQLITGKLADVYRKKALLFWGMLFQGLAIIGLVYADSFLHYVILGVLLGIGTAIVYPTFLAGISDFTHPSQRPQSIGVFRLWRDLGYAIGALLSGILADAFGIPSAIITIGVLTLFSALVIQVRMD